ncbi:MAG: phosphatase PAP2 family protein [Dysgonomonas sp.]|nr:phosphatase PAP2 family protein [Dysgonomonas sp.]
MIDKLIEWDRSLFLFLNSKHFDWLDPFMLFFSSYGCWILASLIMLTFIYIKQKRFRNLSSLFFIISIGASALFTNIIKIIIARPRPIHNSEWENMIHAIEEYEKSYSFFSSHSATTFTMAVFFLLFFRQNKLYGIVAILWATIVAYSRIYLAKHFPLDVFCGILFGTFIAIVGYRILIHIEKKKENALLS